MGSEVRGSRMDLVVSGSTILEAITITITRDIHMPHRRSYSNGCTIGITTSHVRLDHRRYRKPVAISIVNGSFMLWLHYAVAVLLCTCALAKLCYATLRLSYVAAVPHSEERCSALEIADTTANTPCRSQSLYRTFQT